MGNGNEQSGFLKMLVVAGVTVLLTYYFTEYIWTRAGHWIYYENHKDDWTIFFITGFGIAVALIIVSRVFFAGLGIFGGAAKVIGLGGQPGENVSLRRIKGRLVHFVMFAIIVIPASVWVRFNYMEDSQAGPETVLGIPMLAVWFIWKILMERGKGWISTITKPARTLRRTQAFGKGGSSCFATMIEEWGLKYKPGAILLGSSLFGPTGKKMYRIGNKDDRHLLTIASSRSGKGRSAIIPNLITWPHSALVIDPKGTNAAVTAARRGKGGGRVNDFLGQNVHIVDPFGLVKGVKTAHFNPLEAIDLNALSVKEDIELLADALVVPEAGKGAEHWNESARIIIAGIIAHTMTRKKDGKATLMDMRWFLKQPKEDMDGFFEAMAENDEAGSLPMAAASMYRDTGQNEWGSFSTTLTRNTKWIDSTAMEKILDKSDFDMADLKNGNTTIYVVLPPHMLEEHKRFMRLFVNLAVLEMPRGQRAKNPVLFVLDEFFSLGPLAQLEKAAGLLGGYNMKLWPIVQNLTQLKELYQRNWETFVSNAGIIQFFSVNDLETAEYLKKLLGQSAREVEIDGRTVRVVAALREAEELGRALGREEGKQIIVRGDKTPMIKIYSSIWVKLPL